MPFPQRMAWPAGPQRLIANRSARSAVAGPVVTEDPRHVDQAVTGAPPHLGAARSVADHLQVPAASCPGGRAVTRLPGDGDGPRLPGMMGPALHRKTGQRGTSWQLHRCIQTLHRRCGKPIGRRAARCGGEELSLTRQPVVARCDDEPGGDGAALGQASCGAGDGPSSAPPGGCQPRLARDVPPRGPLSPQTPARPS